MFPVLPRWPNSAFFLTTPKTPKKIQMQKIKNPKNLRNPTDFVNNPDYSKLPANKSKRVIWVEPLKKKS
jgi:hypothetical protein